MARGEASPITPSGSGRNQGHEPRRVRWDCDIGMPGVPAVVPGLDAGQPPMGD